MKAYVAYIFFLLVLVGCKDEDKKVIQISAAPINQINIDKHQIGIAYSDGKIACVIYPEKNPTPPQRVLISSSTYRGVITADVGIKLKNCSNRKSREFKDFYPEGDVYELKFVPEIQLYDDLALSASEWTGTLSDGAVVLKKKDIDAAIKVDVCTSNEGIWTSLIQETAAGKRPIYSTYRSVGYDTQATCGSGGYEPLYSQ